MMMGIIKKRVFIYSLILSILVGTTGLSYASLTMGEVQYLFKQETGKQWKDVTAEERKSFLRDIRGLKNVYGDESKEKKEELDRKDDAVGIQKKLVKKKKKAPFAVREKFERDKGKKWEKATERERKVYWGKFKMSEKKWKKKEKMRLRDEQLRVMGIKRERKLQEQRIERKRKEKALKEKLKRQKIARKKREGKRKMAEAKRASKEAAIRSKARHPKRIHR